MALLLLITPPTNTPFIAATPAFSLPQEGESSKDKITNPQVLAKRAAATKCAEERAARAARARAEFKAQGWFRVAAGIYGRWCTKTCSTADVIGDAKYALMEVWAKDRAAGDIYAKANIEKNGVVIGWTNDTAYLSQGQKGVLTFSKYLPGYRYEYDFTLVKFGARG